MSILKPESKYRGYRKTFKAKSPDNIRICPQAKVEIAFELVVVIETDGEADFVKISL